MPTADLPVLDVVAIEWPDEDTPCSWPSCEAGAVWWCECQCGKPTYVCEPHRLAHVDEIKRLPIAAIVGYVLCRNCRARLPLPIAWRPLR